MPLHDYQCPTCGTPLMDQYRSIDEGASARPPLCPDCGDPMSWIPQVQMIDAREPFQQFEVKDGRNRSVTVGSLRQMRQIEHDAEQMARNGEGQRMVWRRYSQDHTNFDVHTIKKDPSEAPTAAAAQRFSPLRHGSSAPDRAYGPGVHDGNTSPLKG